ncbi:hypothetical protein [Streptomyces sp. AC555_RSS877]|uniref:hypothetical protein n=1 Tax=Streptomyces sp. AC555_RSS877 TaxID=2823688 RepID=UPI001C25623C|nr:hypothetical protein [Streptomyces sp. AC555_RSS877]
MTMQRDVHDELRARLHETAGTHEPDRARILARIERGMTEQARLDHRATRPPVFGWVRVVAATTAVAGVLGVGGYAVASAVKEDTPPQRNVAVTATPSPDATSRAPAPPADPTPSAPQQSPEADSSPARTPSASATVEAPAASGVEDGPLWSDGSVDPHSNEFWGQSNVTLKTSGKLTALTVRLKVRQTGGVTSAGAWRSAPEGDFTATVVEQDGFLVYTWVLKPDRSLLAGEWVFAGQYDHDRGGRDARDDNYAITATVGGEQRAVAGDFAARDDDEDDS